MRAGPAPARPRLPRSCSWLDRGLRRARAAAFEDAERSDAAAAGQDEGAAGVEPDARLARDQRIVGEARVEQGVRDHHHLPAEGWRGRRTTPRARSGGPPCRRPDFSHWRSRSSRLTRAIGTSNSATEAGEPVEALLGLRVQDAQPPQRGESRLLVLRDRRPQPAAPAAQQPCPDPRSRVHARERLDQPVGHARAAPAVRILLPRHDDGRHLAPVGGACASQDPPTGLQAAKAGQMLARG